MTNQNSFGITNSVLNIQLLHQLIKKKIPWRNYKSWKVHESRVMGELSTILITTIRPDVISSGQITTVGMTINYPTRGRPAKDFFSCRIRSPVLRMKPQ